MSNRDRPILKEEKIVFKKNSGKMAQKGEKGEKGDNFGELEVKVRQNKSQIHN